MVKVSVGVVKYMCKDVEECTRALQPQSLTQAPMLVFGLHLRLKNCRFVSVQTRARSVRCSYKEGEWLHHLLAWPFFQPISVEGPGPLPIDNLDNWCNLDAGVAFSPNTTSRERLSVDRHDNLGQCLRGQSHHSRWQRILIACSP